MELAGWSGPSMRALYATKGEAFYTGSVRGHRRISGRKATSLYLLVCIFMVMGNQTRQVLHH